MKNIFEEISDIKNTNYTVVDSSWDGLIDHFPNTRFELKYCHAGWNIKIIGEFSEADLSRPSFLPYGEKVSNNLWDFKAERMCSLDYGKFFIKPKRAFFRSNSYMIESRDSTLSRLLSDICAITEFYQVDYSPNSILEGVPKKNSFELRTRLDTNYNHRSIVFSMIRFIEEVAEHLNLG